MRRDIMERCHVTGQMTDSPLNINFRNFLRIVRESVCRRWHNEGEDKTVVSAVVRVQFYSSPRCDFRSGLIDLEDTLSEGQYLSTAAEIAKTKDLPYREGIGPPMYTPTAEFFERPLQIFSDQSRGGEGYSGVRLPADRALSLLNTRWRG